MDSDKRFRLTLILLIGLAFFVAGLGYARWGPKIGGEWVLTTFVLAAIFGLFKNRTLLLPGLAAAMFLIGLWRGGTFMERLLLYDNIVAQTVTFQATAIDDAVYSQRGQLEFAAGKLELVDPFHQSMVGEIDVEGIGVPMIYRGDRLTINGRLFRKRGSQLAGINFAKLTVISRATSPVDSLRRHFAAGMQNALPDQLAAFGLGLLIGQRTTLDGNVEKELITVGLIHIVAVSGYNLTIIIEVVRRLFRRRSRYQTLIFSLLLIGTFLLFTGYSPSIVRAALVSGLSLLAWFWGRTFQPLLLLLGVAALTAGLNPLYLWSNIGWYLSFTAFFGVVVVGPLLNDRLLPGRLKENLLLSTLCETISAQVCTLPVILYIFGRLSVVSIIANVLVVPLTPLAMLLSLIAGLAGMTHLIFARVIVLPGQLILEYMLNVSQLLSKVPYANIEVHINTPQMVCLSFTLLGLVCILQLKVKHKTDIITETQE